MMAEDPLITTDSFVAHVSTVPANQGRTVGLFLRERALASTLAAAPDRKPHVVLMVHGGFGPSIVAYDLQYRDYSFMAVLARAGFDVFTMSFTGYGPSPRPLMDDPCNVDAEFQPLLVPHVLKELAPPRYPFKLVSSRTEWDELETVIRHLRALRGVDRVSLVGWSTGAPRAGGFAALHPDEVDKLVLFGPAPWFPNETAARADAASRERRRCSRRANSCCTAAGRTTCAAKGQLEDPEVCNAYWREIMAVDEVGAGWGPDGEGIIRAPNRMNFGWRANLARIKAPTLVLLGEFDNYARRLEAWKGLTVEHRMFIRIACASHFVSFERGRHLLYRATREWLAQRHGGRRRARRVPGRRGRPAEPVSGGEPPRQ